MYFFPIELIVVGIVCSAVGYAFGLRETKRRLRAHQKVTDRLMNAGFSASIGYHLGGHDDITDASTVYPSYGGISRSGSPFAYSLCNGAHNMLGGSQGGHSSLAANLAATNSNTDFSKQMLLDQVGILGGAAMQNPIMYSTTPSKFARTATSAGRPPTAAPRDGVKRKIYDDIKKEME